MLVQLQQLSKEKEGVEAELQRCREAEQEASNRVHSEDEDEDERMRLVMKQLKSSVCVPPSIRPGSNPRLLL
ncbi:hypothetical protein INR49_031415 [Caranx melampygus]|nr:hypothetical protein INR49_031415 [Caranx melampygus]